MIDIDIEFALGGSLARVLERKTSKPLAKIIDRDRIQCLDIFKVRGMLEGLAPASGFRASAPHRSRARAPRRSQELG